MSANWIDFLKNLLVREIKFEFVFDSYGTYFKLLKIFSFGISRM
jgi:hypothetical protein